MGGIVGVEYLNPLASGAANIHATVLPSLIQEIAWCPVRANPFLESMLLFDEL